MQRIRILIVDDSLDFLDAAARFLTGKPRIEIAGRVTSGREAVERTPVLAPDVVVMDLMMPEMDGLRATRLLKQLTAPPRVIVVSLYDDSSFRDAATSAGADAFLPKRAFSRELLAILEKLFPDPNPDQNDQSQQVQITETKKNGRQ